MIKTSNWAFFLLNNMKTFDIITNHTYLYIDKLNNYPHKTGSQACRILLNIIQPYNQVELQTDNFPYYFQHQQQTYFVCFSHSQQQIAILISKSAKIGVDIEDKEIKDSIAQRFFAKNEQQWLHSLTKKQQRIAKKLLWTLKESIVKSLANKQSLLMTTLKQDIISQYGQDTLQSLLTVTGKKNQLNIIEKTESYLGFLPNFSCGFLVQLESI